MDQGPEMIASSGHFWMTVNESEITELDLINYCKFKILINIHFKDFTLYLNYQFQN